MKIIEHNMEFWPHKSPMPHTYLWKGFVEHEGEPYEIQIEAKKIASGKDYYYMGYIKNTDSIKLYFSDSWLCFGYSNHLNTYKYILKSMKKVIAGDYSAVRGVGHCIDQP